MVQMKRIKKRNKKEKKFVPFHLIKKTIFAIHAIFIYPSSPLLKLN